MYEPIPRDNLIQALTHAKEMVNVIETTLSNELDESVIVNTALLTQLSKLWINIMNTIDPEDFDEDDDDDFDDDFEEDDFVEEEE